MAQSVPQGADCTIRVTGVLDADGVPPDLTGWTIVAQARVRPGAELLAEWRGTPTGDQGQATGNADGTIDLAVPAAMSDLWTWSVARMHCEATEPVGQQRQARVAEETLYLDPAIVQA